MHQSRYSLIESGNEITVSKLIEIAKVLDVPVSYFFEKNLQSLIDDLEAKQKYMIENLENLLQVNRENSMSMNLPQTEHSLVEALKRKIEDQNETLSYQKHLIDQQAAIISNLTQSNRLKNRNTI